MNQFINRLKNKLSINNLKILQHILLYVLFISIGLGLLFVSIQLPLKEVCLYLLIIISVIATIISVFFCRSYSIIFIIFLLLFGPVGAIHIGNKTPNIFYEDFYLFFLFCLFITIWLQKKKTAFIVSNYAPWILGFLGMTIISLFVTPDLFRGIGFLKLYLTGFLVLFLCINIINKESVSQKIIYSLPLFGAILAGWLYYNVSTSGTLTKSVVSVSWGHSNYLATFFIFLIPMTLGLLFYKKNAILTKFYLSISLILMVVGLITTESRGALVAFLVSLIIFIFKTFHKNKVKIIVLIVLFTIIVMLHPATKIMFYKIYNLNGRFLSGRKIIYYGALKTFLVHPIIGSGTGSLQYYMQKFTNGSTYKAHNEYLHILAEMGVLGLFFFISLLVISYKNIRKLIGVIPHDSYFYYWTIGVLSGFIGVLVHIFVESSFFGYQFFILFWITMSIIYINFKILNKKWLIQPYQ